MGLIFAVDRYSFWIYSGLLDQGLRLDHFVCVLVRISVTDLDPNPDICPLTVDH